MSVVGVSTVSREKATIPKLFVRETGNFEICYIIGDIGKLFMQVVRFLILKMRDCIVFFYK